MPATAPASAVTVNQALLSVPAAIPQGSTVPYILARSAVAVAVPAASTTAEATLATITVPGGALGPNGMVRLALSMSASNNAGNKTIRVRYSGAAGTIISSTTITTNISTASVLMINNRNDVASQVGCSLGDHIAAWLNTVATTTVDTRFDSTIVITGQKSVAAETATLEFYLAELIYGV